MSSFSIAMREAVWILLIGSLFGFAYTGVTGKGLFAPEEPAAVPVFDRDSASADEEAVAEYIDFMETLAAFEAGDAILIDSRHNFDYELGHIRGAVNVPLKEYDERKEATRNWPKDALLITYCDGQECNSSIDLANKLIADGFVNVKFFFGGWSEWVANDGPRERTEQ